MIELQLTIDPSKTPVTGYVASGANMPPTAFIGYVELISALERLLPGDGGDSPAGGGDGRP